MDITPLKKMLKKYINEDRIRTSELDFGLVTFSLTDFKPVAVFKNNIPKGLLIDYLLASSCLPGFQSTKIENKRFLDGGIYDNIPISLMLKKGIKNIIVVDVSGIGRIKKVNLKGVNVIYIKNSDPLCKTLEFEAEAVKKGITMGYMDALKTFGIYTGKRYYIKNSETQSKMTAALHQDELALLDAMLDMKANSAIANKLINYPLLRILYKYVSGKLNSSSLIYATAEIAAEVFGIDRYSVYTWDELVEEVMKAYTTIKISTDADKNQNLMRSLLRSSKHEDAETLDLKGLAAINTDFEHQDLNSKLYRKLMAIFIPKVCIANIFVSLMLWRARP
jgi:NTE family protein